MYPVSDAFLQAVQGNHPEVLLDGEDHHGRRCGVSL